MTRTVLSAALLTLVLSPAALAADDDGELMKQVDADAFDTDDEEEEQWEVPDEAKTDVEGDDPDEGFGPVDEDPDAGLGEDPDEGLSEDPDEGFAPDPDEGFDADPVEAPARAAPPAGRQAPKGLDTDGKSPLAGSFRATVVMVDVDAVTVELPVLVAQNASSWSDAEYWLVAEYSVQGKKVGEARHLVSAAHLSDLAPSIAWLKAQVPVLEQEGEVEVKVSKMGADGSPSELFSKRVSYTL
jgi:hypothetical protein